MSNVSISEASRNLSHWVNRAGYGRDLVVLTSRGRAKAVILGIETFERLIDIHQYVHRPLVPLGQLRQELHQAMEEAGYHSREDVIALIQDVKREQADEWLGSTTAPETT